MSDCSEHKNPLQHNGTSQPQRFLPGMDLDNYALADEKEYGDWIVFAAEFARYIRYYGSDHLSTRDWQAFFTGDISAKLGLIAIQDIDRYRTEIKDRLDYIRDDDNSASLGIIYMKLNELFSALLTLSKALDETLAQLPEETSLKSTIFNLVRTKLAPALKQLLAYHKAAGTLGYLDHSVTTSWKILNYPLTDAMEIISAEGLGSAWWHGSGASGWNDYINAIAEDDSIFNNPLTEFSKDYYSIEHAANHNLFTGIFDTYLTAYTRIIGEAETELLRTLESYDAHTPHYTLFLTFLRLFRISRDHLNTLTRRHLDFYYREVLKLAPKAAEANQVHVLGELAKHVDEYLLASGTALKAGKDSLNKEVLYTLDADTVLNKAAVARLISFYKGDADESLEIFARPEGRMGFALASHYLYLAEGERKVFVRLVTNPAAILDGKKIECWLTTEKEWYRAESVSINSSGIKLSNSTTGCTEISFTIPGSAPAIVNYNAAVHEGLFNCDLPVLKMILAHDDSSDDEYDLLKDVTFTQMEIRVEVGMGSSFNQKGLKNLVLSNDLGPVDASKPFMPFGIQPTAGNRLVIGSKEIFSKKNATVQLYLEWKDLPGNKSKVSYESLDDEGHFPNIDIKILKNGIWDKLAGDVELFSTKKKNKVSPKRLISTEGFVLDDAITGYGENYGAYSLNSVDGFAALQLTEGFGHKKYLSALTDYFIRQANNVASDDIDMPDEPYTPVLQSLYAGYSAFSRTDLSSASSFAGREIRFFHLYPFGEAELTTISAEPGFLLPQFKHLEDGNPEPHEGEFYIGIENLGPGQSVNLLFQVLEGTTDPLLTKPKKHVHWSYLGNNEWIAFEDGEYSDSTLDLVQSGIISFAIPQGATTENTLLPPGHIWIRAAITKAAGAVCKLVSVDAQAALATFSNQENAGDFLDHPLAAGTISKLKVTDASVKKLIQPYSSFGGRQKESDGHFNIRVSERLRHKSRAITVWDYERLVLENFPEIYKVKCLNHTQSEEGIYNEIKPGHVSIITIPSLQNRNDTNPLKPYTQQSTLTNIENYLKKKVSCFVRLRACQPQFEEVRLEFSLKLHEAFRDFVFYSTRLKEEITQYLSPWAYGSPSSIDFGGKVYKSAVINFIEERYYVDYITDVFMYVKTDEESVESADLDEVTASAARSILVSAPASKHVIHEIVISDESLTEPCPNTLNNNTQ
jgi:hypothetical protein